MVLPQRHPAGPARGGINTLHIALDVSQRHRLAGIAHEREFAVHRALHRVDCAVEHAVEYLAAHLQLYFRDAARRCAQRTDHAAHLQAEVELQSQVVGGELQRDVLVRAERIQGRVRRHAGAELFQDRRHFFNDLRRGNHRRGNDRRGLFGWCGLRGFRRLGVALQVGHGRAALVAEPGQFRLIRLRLDALPVERRQRLRIEHVARRLATQ